MEIPENWIHSPGIFPYPGNGDNRFLVFGMTAFLESETTKRKLSNKNQNMKIVSTRFDCPVLSLLLAVGCEGFAICYTAISNFNQVGRYLHSKVMLSSYFVIVGPLTSCLQFLMTGIKYSAKQAYNRLVLLI